MRLSELQHHAELFRTLQAINREIESLYDTRQAIQYDHQSGTGKRSGKGSSPTERAVFRIEEIREESHEIEQEYLSTLGDIDTWLQGITDHYFRAIIRARFLLCKDWKTIQRECGNHSGSTSGSCRQYLKRNAERYGLVLDDPKDRD
ncbi:MAG: hypothetical protein IJJ44_03750 [Solobacterium sp.]|nr:hypothetical protein [Solobacterium sp.]